jgi:hypothetical protein
LRRRVQTPVLLPFPLHAAFPAALALHSVDLHCKSAAPIALNLLCE